MGTNNCQIDCWADQELKFSKRIRNLGENEENGKRNNCMIRARDIKKDFNKFTYSSQNASGNHKPSLKNFYI